MHFESCENSNSQQPYGQSTFNNIIDGMKISFRKYLDLFCAFRFSKLNIKFIYVLSIDIDSRIIYGNQSLPNISNNKKNKNSIDQDTLNKYYCHKESIREKQHRSYINQMEMDEIMTYAYSSDENDFSNERTNPKDSDDDSLGKKYFFILIRGRKLF